MSKIEVEVRLRRKNQVTLPDPIAARLGAQPGDHLVIAIDDANPDQAQVRLLPRSYAGVAAGVYGAPGEVAEYLRAEREAWDE